MSVSILRATTSKTERRTASSISLGTPNKLGYTKKSFLPKRTTSQLDFEKDSEILSVMNLDHWEGTHTNETQNPLNQVNKNLIPKANLPNTVEENIHRRQSKIKPITNHEQQKLTSRQFKDYEGSLFETFKQIEQKLQDSLKIRENKRKKLCELKEEMYNYQQFLDKIPKGIIKKQGFRGDKMKTGNEIVNYLTQKQLIKEKNEKARFECMQQMEILQIEISSINRELQQCDEETSKIRKEIKASKNELIFHYIDLLRQGTDTRTEGLAWIIKALKNLGKEIRKEMLPSGMDDKSVKVVLEIAEKMKQLDECYEILSISKIPQQKKKFEEPVPIHERLNLVKKCLRIRRPEFSKKKLSWAGEELLQYQENNWKKNHVSDAIKLEEQVKKLKSEIYEIQVMETKRLTKECVKNGNNLKTSVARIVGIENLEKFLIVSMKELKGIDVLRQSISTFTFSSKLMPKLISRGILNSIYV